MISIIISSYIPEYFESLEKNIADTCGVVYEIIKIDNPGIMGTSEAYNKGALLAKYDIFLFIHEDIKFITTNWGSLLINHHLLEKTGVIGLAGGKYVPSTPSGWYTDYENALITIVQTEKDKSKKKIQTFSGVQKAFALDGVFLSIKKIIFKQYKFDEHLTAYHGYDTEITLRIAKTYLNYVISDILVEHFSAGNPDQKWFEENMQIRRKLGSNFKHSIDKNLEFSLYCQFLKQYFEYYPKTYRNLYRILFFFPILKIGKRKYITLINLIYSISHE